MISFSALAEKRDAYAIVPEAHGRGKLKPLIFLCVQGGLNPGEAPFEAEAMWITERGTVEFGRSRIGGPLKRPVDSITLEQPQPRAAGAYDSDYFKWVGKGSNGAVVRRANWRANVRVDSPRGRSAFVLQNNTDDRPYADKLEVSARGDVELQTNGAAVILRSPNGKRWRVTVDDSGQLQARAAG